jgi:tRNA threonylcarbamoyladenosine biosynthesis protein TsaE
MTKKQIIAKHTGDLDAIAREMLNTYPDHRVFAFYGEMGAGKTTFIKTLCKQLGVSDNVASPTFAIINAYLATDQSEIYHFDFYRIKKLQEAMDIGAEEYFYSGNYCFIEWPELVAELLPDDSIVVNIEIGQGEQERIFRF